MINDDITVGSVIEIKGNYVRARMYQNTNMMTYFKNNQVYRGVGIGQYVGIVNGPYKLVGKVTREFADDKSKDPNDQEFSLNRYIREVNINIIGNFRNKKFIQGIYGFPQIFSEIVLLSDDEIKMIIGNNVNSDYQLNIGYTVPDKVPFSLDWSHLFNTHFAIFGNTGSGKSNTLTKIYTELFKKDENNEISLKKSKFIFIDFNGEYTSNEIFSQNKSVLNLNTKKINGQDKLILSNTEFWDAEFLSVLFSATSQTQEPFLRATLNFFKPGKHFNNKKLIHYLTEGLKNTYFSTHMDARTQPLLNKILAILHIEFEKGSELEELLDSNWNNKYSQYYMRNGSYVNKLNRDDLIAKFESKFAQNLKREVEPLNLLMILLYLEMIFKLKYGNSQYEYISYFLSRVESKENMFCKVVKVSDEYVNENNIKIISLRNVNKEIKLIVPLIVARQSYKNQKENNDGNTELKSTTHLIIDEAHNILSTSSNRERKEWRDYRLDVFEEIVKEGRKFGFYLTISSQRPADISQTIVSQMHNYIIHRLVNQNDLEMLDNSLNSLDMISRQSIPTLSAGSAVFTGINFELPVVVKVDKLMDKLSPNSNSANLTRLWSLNKNN
ncbi:ATP-binding protein [Companilactobacillus bobalius]|uniref:Helicase HerA central domain-containing protein n=2 Tax=Companilactobacillus bobalius TaxID=2801451 RepID=A0A0R1KVT7_9LACO|nr:ATP-binding protein [Companilactobacillus bobalius]KAE9558840.1 hypothetical protein ATN92_13060 [Companilactobacillus bobalius]KRK84122.1 hypothetical protein FC78_GL001131 [Companilactobacillus bobalius DSM 19674]OVE97185.1 putative DNA double-strand break repair helicase HerA [Companilactobacillus bobalius]GEO58770.1 hypothetical protein LBO01_18990 [Companilactobacillus paralimentarius]